MMPLFDENPTQRRPLATWALITICLAASVAPLLGTGSGRSLEDRSGTSIELSATVMHHLRWAAIPCEVRHHRPLNQIEVAATHGPSADATACQGPGADDDEPLISDKPVLATVVSSMFLHDGWLHLLINMLFLWVFGNNVEDRLGRIAFLGHYLLTGVVATGTYMAFVPDGTLPILGASGAVAGVMGSYLVWYPDAPIRTLVFLIVVDIRARWFLGGWFAFQFFTWSGPGAWIAHVAGFVFGAIVGRLVRKYQPLLRQSADQIRRPWDRTGGAGHGPYPHLDEVWDEPHTSVYRRR